MSNGSEHVVKPDDESEKSKSAYLAEIMAHESELAAMPKPKAKRRSWLPTLMALVAILAGLLAWNVARIIYNPPVFTAEEIEADALFSLYLISQGLEAYWDSAGTLPMSLEAVELDDEYVRYARMNDSSYALTVMVDTTQLVYRRGEDVSRFTTAFDVLAGGAKP